MLKLFDEHSLDDLSSAPEVGDELDNLRHAADWARQAQDGGLLARLATIPGNWYFNIFRAWDEWLDWLDQSLQLKIGNDGLEANVRQARGDVLQFRKDMDGALAEYAQALALYEAVGDRLGQANTICGIGKVHLALGEQPKADALLEQAIEIFKVIGDRYSIAAQTGNYGWTLYNLDRKDQARPYLLRAAELFEAMGLLDYAELHRRAAEA